MKQKIFIPDYAIELAKRVGARNAQSVAITSSYAGEVADVLLALTKNGNQAVEKGSVYVEPGVQKELFIPIMTTEDDALQASSPTPTTPSESFVYSERSIAPADMMFYDTVNPRNFEDVWRPFQPVGPLVDRVDNPKVQAAIIQEALKSVGKQLGKLVWAGDTLGAAALAFFDGFEKVIANEAGSIKVTPAGAITAANVISILEACEAAIPSEIWEDPSVVFHMNTTDFRLYQEAARALDFKGPNIGDAMQERFAGRQIRYYTGMTKNKVIIAKATAGKDSNLWAAVDVANDTETVKIERYRPESELFIVKVLFKYGVNVGLPEETIIYLPA